MIEPNSEARFITFYSYKGGVGRTFILANVALQLAAWGKRVLCMDWDLEAPGLETYFPETYAKSSAFVRTGVIGLVEQLNDLQLGQITFAELVRGRVAVHQQNSPSAADLHLLFAGPVEEPNYPNRVSKLDWQKSYREYDFGNKLAMLRKQIASHYDYVLIDSRTGVSDSAGVCIAHLPDILALVFTSNSQSLVGAARIGAWAVKEKQHFFHSESKLKVLPILSRLDFRSNPETAAGWIGRIATGELLDKFFYDWLDTRVSQQDFIAATGFPYTPAFSYGEPLVSADEAGNAPENVCLIPEQLNYYVQGLAALLIHDLGRSHDLLNNRVPTIAQAINPGLQPIYQPERFEVFGRSSRMPLNVEKLKLRSLHQLLVQKLLILFESPANRSMEIPPLVGELDAMRRTLLLPPIKGRDEITAEYLGALLREFDSATLGSVKPFTHDSPDGNTLARLNVDRYLADTSVNMRSKALLDQPQSAPPSVALPER